MPAPMSRQKSNFASLQFAKDERIRWIAERSFHPLFMNICEARHGIKPASADNSNLRLGQIALLLVVLQPVQYIKPKRYLMITTFMLQGVRVNVRGRPCAPISLVLGAAHTGLAEFVWS